MAVLCHDATHLTTDQSMMRETFPFSELLDAPTTSDPAALDAVSNHRTPKDASSLITFSATTLSPSPHFVVQSPAASIACEPTHNLLCN